MGSAKQKTFSDPIYGFIPIDDPLVFSLIEHPFFQRLRRIHQLGLTNLIYPGANHTRFHHAIGATHLMMQAIEVLRAKGVQITDDEARGAAVAILLHDIGHGPYSHTLEGVLLEGTAHEAVSLAFMEMLNKEFDGALSTGIEIFKGQYPRRFLCQLVSSQLDIDRLDYLMRDSFFSGVSEGVVGVDRIVQMMHVVDDELVIEQKGIYSVEKFIVARRLMYWQVYLHKTVVVAEKLLLQLFRRVKDLLGDGVEVQATDALQPFLKGNYSLSDGDPELLLQAFAAMDDYDVMASIKSWVQHDDKVLSTLAGMVVNRQMFKIRLSDEPFAEAEINNAKAQAVKHLGVDQGQASYFVATGHITNQAYNTQGTQINILKKNQQVVPLAAEADLLNSAVLSDDVRKYYLCYLSF